MYQKRNADMIFSECWGFGYSKNDQPFGVSLDINAQNRRLLLLEKFHGIKIGVIKYQNIETLMNIIQKTLQFSPIILPCDVFKCPWNISYQRHHIDHYILAIGIDENTRHIYILDPYSTEEINIINITNVIPASGCIYFFETLPLISLKLEEYQKELEYSLHHIVNSNFFSNIKNFQIEFTDRFEEIIYSQYTDIYAIPLIFNLNRIANQRHCYCVFLNRMLEKGLIDSSLLNQMEVIAEKYSLFRLLLIKQIMKKSRNSYCNEILNDIIENEYVAYKRLNSFL